MSDKPLFIYVATYADREHALLDYNALLDLHETRHVRSYDVAVIAKDSDGKVHVEKHEETTQRGMWGGILVGAFVGVLFPPGLVGVATVGGAAAVGGLLGGIGGHLLDGMSRGDAKELGDLLEAHQAALIVVGESRAASELEETLTHALKSVEKEVGADHTRLKRELEDAEKQLAAE